MVAPLSRRLDELRELFLHDSKDFAGTECLLIHQHESEVCWPTDDWPTYPLPPDKVVYSVSPREVRLHFFERSNSSGDNIESTIAGAQRFKARGGEAGQWLWSQNLPEFSNLPGGISADQFWLWALVEFCTGVHIDEAHRIEKFYWLEPTMPDKSGRKVAWPETMEDLDSFRNTLRNQPAWCHLVESVPVLLPKSFYCHFPDVFHASRLLLDWLETQIGKRGGRPRKGANKWNEDLIEYYKANPAAGPRAVLRSLKCGAKMLYSLPAFKAVKKEKDKGRRPKIVSLTPNMAAAASKDSDDTLAKLKREQQRDMRSDTVMARERNK